VEAFYYRIPGDKQTNWQVCAGFQSSLADGQWAKTNLWADIVDTGPACKMAAGATIGEPQLIVVLIKYEISCFHICVFILFS
jgi:hypothetical protein